jgi:predicted AAA+ superfamily ATPase
MALSNRDRVGRAFELLATGLEGYVDRRMRATSRSGKDWLGQWADSATPPIRGPVALHDPSLLLRVMAESWEASFKSELGRSDRNLVFELRDVRNKWAHNDPFTMDDAYRALDSIERFLMAVDAREASEVGRAKEELMRLKFEAQARKATPDAATLMSAPTAGLKPWREVIVPHDDVARGRYALAEFAADLHQVWLGDGAAEYADPVEFFQRTFLTAGLRQLLGEAVDRIKGGGSPPIVDLQTSFGGGKTHSMIALYHLFSGTPLARFPQELQDLVREAGATEVPVVRRAVLVGTRIAPGQAVVKEDGTEVGTLWGEMAWQLGGREAFDVVADSDATRSNPGDALRRLLATFSPAVILIDEWVAYARALYADDTLRGGTFDTHFSFAQMLTEAVRSTPGVLLVVSIPASESPDGSPIGSEAEVGGAGGREALRRLRVVIGRMESSWRPATSDESFEIVRRRLFQPVDTARLVDRDATARAFGELYRAQASEFPAECREPGYAKRMERAYPIHPELFARLYEDWSTLERFQRTRGVLRLMATVISALWSGGDQSPLILPASVPLAESAVANELTRNLEDSWKPIIDADIDGPGSLPLALDNEFKNLGRYGAARRVARTVFLGSAPLAGSPNQGLDTARIRLGCALPGETIAIYGDALNRLADRATYFYVSQGRAWYGTQPGVARLARDRAERLLGAGRHEIHDQIKRRLEVDARSKEDVAGVHVMPGGPGDVADTPEVRLVVLGPDEPHVPRSDSSPALIVAREMLDSRGSAPREYRNMLLFLGLDQRRLDDLEQGTAEYLAWESVVAEADALDLGQAQRAQAQQRLADAGSTVGLRLADAYQWLLVPRQVEPTGPISWEEVKADGQGGVVQRAVLKLVHGGALYTNYPPVLLRLQLDGPLAPLWEKGDTTVDAVWEAYARYLYLHRLRDVRVLCHSVESGPGSTTWASEGFAVAEAVDTKSGCHVGLVTGGFASGVRGASLLVRPDVATAELAEVSEPATDGGGGDAGDGRASVGGGNVTVRRRFYGVASVSPERLGRDAGRIAEEVVAHLAGLDGTEVEVTVEIRAKNEGGFPDAVVKLVSENASSLRFAESGFEAT